MQRHDRAALGADVGHAEATEDRTRRRRQHPHHEQEEDRRAGGDEQDPHPWLPGVGAGPEGVSDGQQVHEDRGAVQLAPQPGPDPMPDPVAEPEDGGQPSAGHTQAGPQRLVLAGERHRDVADGRRQEAVAEQSDAVHRDRHEPDKGRLLMYREQRPRQGGASRDATGHRQADAHRDGDAEQRHDARGAGGQPPAEFSGVGASHRATASNGPMACTSPPA
jgi:hypothetical protein